MSEPDLTVEEIYTPSWQQWPPNCCETCVGWVPKGERDPYIGICEQPSSTNLCSPTDSRFRCPDFKRKS